MNDSYYYFSVECIVYSPDCWLHEKRLLVAFKAHTDWDNAPIDLFFEHLRDITTSMGFDNDCYFGKITEAEYNKSPLKCDTF